MARIAGVDIPRDKRLEVALTYIYGIGPTKAKEILQQTQIENKRVYELTADEIARLRDHIDRHYVVEGDLRREQQEKDRGLAPKTAAPEPERERAEHQQHQDGTDAVREMDGGAR
ncbi:MAG: 30S ribosomal protein S13, partial [Caldilineales bacterium]|nr:30S ribosomal protein S13 [Caldilineales bacterium]